MTCDNQLCLKEIEPSIIQLTVAHPTVRPGHVDFNVAATWEYWHFCDVECLRQWATVCVAEARSEIAR